MDSARLSALARLTDANRARALDVARERGLWRQLVGETADSVRPGLEVVIDDADPEIAIEPAGVRVAKYTPAVTAWPSIESLEDLEPVLEQLGSVEMIYPAGGCAGDHEGRCLRLICTTRDVRVRWVPGWTGRIKAELVTAWVPEVCA